MKKIMGASKERRQSTIGKLRNETDSDRVDIKMRTNKPLGKLRLFLFCGTGFCT
jgi:hypothetical protein